MGDILDDGFLSAAGRKLCSLKKFANVLQYVHS
jgi:hypothetical protein